jgi:HlyD family secretion protein
MRSLKRAVTTLLVVGVVVFGVWLVRSGKWTTAVDGGDATAAPKAPNGGGPVPLAAVTALGRLEPKDGVIRVAGPSRPSTVIARLSVDEGDVVKAGQVIAVLDSVAEDQARVARLQAELTNAKADWDRWYQLFKTGSASASLRDTAQMKVDVAKAELQAAQASLDLATVRAPVAGQVIKIYSRSGERVGPNGICEIAQNDVMYAIAEVYETDIRHVRLGQRAKVTSPALAVPLEGRVDYIGLKIGKADVLSTDPAARTDARVVEVKIRLDDAARAAGLTNLQVDVAIQPAS